MDPWQQAWTARGFTGRDWFFRDLSEWLEQPDSSLWLVEAEPGWGKSALAREIKKRFPGTQLQEPGPSPTGAAPLVIIDEPEEISWKDVPTSKTVVFTRPRRSLAQLRRPGVRWNRFHSLEVQNLQDLARHVADLPRADQIVRASAGNFAAAGLLLNTHDEVEVWRFYYELAASCWSQAEHPELSVQMLTLLAEMMAPLEVWRICDFLGLSAVKVRQSLTSLEPILRRQGDSYQVFHPLLARAVSWAHFRDLEVIHASIISYFRETYPSWEEMSDPYGWDNLVHHCDRFARTSRKKDFSVLHWLGEGPFLRQKLRQGGKLPGVLRDLERCLVAAMEDEDLSRIAFYSFQLPRIRQERLAGEMHRLADLGQIEAAHEYAQLIPRETHRLLALLLLTWQAADEQQFALADQLLSQALQVDSGDLFPEMNLLLVSLSACLLKSLPHREADILGLLSRDSHTGRAASNYLTLGLIEGLEDRLRNWVLRRGWTQAAKGSGRDQQRLSTFIGQSLRALKQNELAQFWSGVLTRPQLTHEVFDQRLRQACELESEQDRLDQITELADQVCRLHPKDWLGHAIAALTQSLQHFHSGDSWLRGFAQLSRLWMTLGPIPEAFDGLERLTQLAKEMDLENTLRVRIIADLSLGFYRLGDSSRSQQLISRAAASAVSETSPEAKAAALAFVAAATAQLGNPSRARDLGFTLLESIEPPPGPVQDHFCRLTFRLASSGSGPGNPLRQSLGQDPRDLNGLGNTPLERSYLLLGLARAAHQSGDAEWADQLLQQTATQARQITEPKVLARTLADVACLAWDLGQHDRYRALLEEGEEALGQEQWPIQRLEGKVDLCKALSHSKDRKVRAEHREVLRQLQEVSVLDVCLSPTLPRLLPMLQEAEAERQAQELMERLRQEPEGVSERERDLYYSGLIRLELAFHEYDRALAALNPIRSPEVRSLALVDLAVGLTARDPREGLDWVPAIPRQFDRIRALRMILSELGLEKRPWRKSAGLEALRKLTLLAQEDEPTMDLVVSFWLTRENDVRKFEAAGKRMGWAQEHNPLLVRTPS